MSQLLQTLAPVSLTTLLFSGSQPSDNSESIKRKILDEEQRTRQHFESIQGMRQRLAEMQQRQEFSEWGFVSDNEIRGIRELNDKILLRLNAPKGSILHVPNHAGQFELFLSVPPDLKVVLHFLTSASRPPLFCFCTTRCIF